MFWLYEYSIPQKIFLWFAKTPQKTHLNALYFYGNELWCENIDEGQGYYRSSWWQGSVRPYAETRGNKMMPQAEFGRECGGVEMGRGS